MKTASWRLLFILVGSAVALLLLYFWQPPTGAPAYLIIGTSIALVTLVGDVVRRRLSKKKGDAR